MSMICCRGPRSTLPVRTAANGIRSHDRPFSTSKPDGISLQLNRNDPEKVADAVPPYPYGPTRWYKQSRLGLYGGQRIQFGNNVGQKIAVKTRRSWHPNVVNKNLFSRSLNRFVQLRVTTRTLRTIDKLGGLDEYLLGEKEARIKALGESGWWLRWAIMQTSYIKHRFAAERRRLAVEAGLSHQDIEENTQEQNEENAQEQNEEAIEEAIEVASEAEVEDALEHGEAVAEDGAFEVETSNELPALKFRVGPRAHMVLTSAGWRRVRRSEEYHDKAQAKRKTEQQVRRFGPRFNAAIEEARAFLAEEMSKAEEGTRWNIKELLTRLNSRLGGVYDMNGFYGVIGKRSEGRQMITIAELQKLQAALDSRTHKMSAMVSARARIGNRMLEREKWLRKQRAGVRLQKRVEKSALAQAAAELEQLETVSQGSEGVHMAS